MWLALAAVVLAVPVLAVPVLAQGAPRLRFALASPTPTENGAFGRALLQASDYDADGVADYLVGAAGEADIGRVHALSGRTGDPLWAAVGPFACDFSCNFGDALARLPDVTGDGIDDLVVGAPDEPRGGALAAGAAYLVSGADGTRRWRVQSPTPSLLDGDKFGRSVVAAGDVNGDGWADVVVSEPGNYDHPPLHVYSGRSGARQFSREERASALAPLADRTGDGGPEFVGVLGGVLVHDGSAAVPVDTLPRPGTGPYSVLNAVAEVGDLDGDGVAEIVVGSRFAGVPVPLGAVPRGAVPPGAVSLVAGTPGPGRAYVLSGATGAVRDSLLSPTPQDFNNFGFAVAGGRDVTGDGVADVAVGAPYESTGGFGSQGHAYVYSGADGSLVHTLTAPVDHYSVHFGWSVAFVTLPEGGAGLAVGAPGATPEGSPDFAGRVYVYAFGDSTVATAPGPEAAGLSVAVWPNPSAGASWVTLTASSPQAVRVVVVDALGRTVAVVHEGPVAAGSARVSLPVGLAVGVYAVVAEGAGARVQGRWVVAR